MDKWERNLREKSRLEHEQFLKEHETYCKEINRLADKRIENQIRQEKEDKIQTGYVQDLQEENEMLKQKLKELEELLGAYQEDCLSKL